MSTESDVVEEAEDTVETDPAREAIARAFEEELGDGFIESHIVAGKDLIIRIDRGSWVAAAEFARTKLGMTWLDFISAIDWMPSPFGRDMEAEQDWAVDGRKESEPEEQTTGLAGGDTRFQMMLRVYSTDEHMGVTIKADVPADDPSIETLIPVYDGANWHEREVWEMFGINIAGHPDLRVLYLPSGFEGNPMRKDFPLVSRRVKPWPGIVDVEGMPTDDAGDDAGDDTPKDDVDADGAAEVGEAS